MLSIYLTTQQLPRCICSTYTNSLPVTTPQVQNATKTDPHLRQVWNFVREGWPKEVAEQLKSFFNCKDELTMEGDCILWGVHIVIPRKLRSEVLQELHRNHPGISQMKSIVRSYVWWPSINHDIEDTAKGCSSCQGSRNSPSVAPLHPWSWPARPWERIHLDVFDAGRCSFKMARGSQNEVNNHQKHCPGIASPVFILRVASPDSD